MSFQRFMKKFCCFLVLLPLLSGTWLVRAAQITDKYPLALKIGTTIKANVKFGRNKKEKTVQSVVWGPQGRLLRDSACRSWVLNEDALSPCRISKNTKYPWRYVVALSCKRDGRAPKEIIQRLVEDLLPESERHRLAIILNINEKIVGFDEEVRNKTCKELTDLIPQQDIDAIRGYGVPILILYSQWTSYREDAQNPTLSAERVRAEIYKELDALGQKCKKEYENRLLELHNTVDDKDAKAIREKYFKNYEAQLAKFNEEKQVEFQFTLTLKHALDFPFGAMRTLLVSNNESKKFLAALHNDNVGLYLHIQDSDFTNLKVSPMFYGWFGVQEVVQANQDFLFKRYDALIDHQLMTRGCMPVVLGGAYVYDPGEDLKGKGQKSISTAAKYWSRFAIEMSNILKLIIGQYAPYGLYFHEPNTLVLLHAPQGKEVAGGTVLERTLEKGNIEFGPFCEVQDFTRRLTMGCDLVQQRDAVVFDPSIIVATSMKSAKRNFDVKHEGGYDPGTNSFTMQSARKCDCTSDSLKHLHGAKQGGLKPQDVSGVIATGFCQFLSVNAKSKITELIKLFDPYWMTDVCDSENLTHVLRNYEQGIERNRQEIKNKYGELQVHYNNKGNGKEIAYTLVAIAWECGQAKRLMLLDHLVSPGAWVEPASVTDVRKLLSLRLDHTRYDSGFPTQSYFVGDLLELNSPAQDIRQKNIWDVVAELYKEYSQRGVASVLGSSQATIRKLLAKEKAPQAIPAIYYSLRRALQERKSSDEARTFVKISYLV